MVVGNRRGGSGSRTTSCLFWNKIGCGDWPLSSSKTFHHPFDEKELEKTVYHFLGEPDVSRIQAEIVTFDKVVVNYNIHFLTRQLVLTVVTQDRKYGMEE